MIDWDDDTIGLAATDAVSKDFMGVRCEPEVDQINACGKDSSVAAIRPSQLYLIRTEFRCQSARTESHH